MCGKSDNTTNLDCSLECRKRIVGFDAKNKNFLPLYICHLCTFLLRDPCQLDCGHRFCRLCIETEEKSTIKCNRCNEETPTDKISLDKGCKRDMENLNINCSFCEWCGIFKNYEEHLDKSHSNPTCEYCNKEFDTIYSFTEHKLVCEKMIIECVLHPYGCDEQFLRMNTQDHLLSIQHQNILLKYLCKTVLPSIDSTSTQQIIPSHTTMPIEKIINKNSDVNISQLYETMDTFLGGVQALSDDTQHLSSELLRYQTTFKVISDDLSKIQTTVEETHSLVNAHKSNQQILEENLNSLQQQLNNQKNNSYDGTLLWKITDIQKKIADAQSEQQTSIYSPIFYSSPNGYKMRVRLYFAGDGNARRTHMSIFFVLMRGEYDAILEFPFHFKVTFCVLDQTSQHQHIIDSFRPDIKSSSFQRPNSDMNIASGIPKFVPLTIIHQDNNPYVQNDTMFIKVLVHFNDIPKTILPYKLCLNPGLPDLIQQAIVKREIESRTSNKLLNTTDTTRSMKPVI